MLITEGIVNVYQVTDLSGNIKPAQFYAHTWGLADAAFTSGMTGLSWWLRSAAVSNCVGLLGL